MLFDNIKKIGRSVYDSLPSGIKTVLDSSKKVLDNPAVKLGSIALSHFFPAVGVPLTAYEIGSELSQLI
jgi:hypothetical protein